MSTDSIPDDELIQDNFDAEAEEGYPATYSISSHGADYPVDGLVKRIRTGAIYIPQFQRSYVWNIYKASRFIESLLLGLPVPAVFLSKELDSNKMLVIDGQQRLTTLRYFYDGIFSPLRSEFALKGVQEKFLNKTYTTLNEDDKMKLDDSLIHAIIIKQDSPDESTDNGPAPSSAYYIFERLNTGGVLLQPQEIRACIYHGQLIDLLGQLNSNQDWRALYGRVSTRMRDRELILRFLALYFEAHNYIRPMKEFLNSFVGKHRKLNTPESAQFLTIFEKTVQQIKQCIGEDAFRLRRSINAALCDSVMVGIARRLSANDAPIDPNKTKVAFASLVKNASFETAVSSGTTDEANVAERLTLATQAFANC